MYNSNNRLSGSCSRKAGLDNDTYAYRYNKIHKIRKIHNNSRTTKVVRTVIYVDQVVQLSYGNLQRTVLTICIDCLV